LNPSGTEIMESCWCERKDPIVRINKAEDFDLHYHHPSSLNLIRGRRESASISAKQENNFHPGKIILLPQKKEKVRLFVFFCACYHLLDSGI